MAFPPAALPSNRTDSTPQLANHASDHNAMALAIADLVAEIQRPRIIAKSYSEAAWSTTSVQAQPIDPLAIVIANPVNGKRWLLRAVLFVGANANVDDMNAFILVNQQPLGGSGASAVGSTGYHRFNAAGANAQGLEVACVVLESVAPFPEGNVRCVPAIQVRTTDPVQQVMLNRRGADTAHIFVSTFSATEL
jgi:hypothetical protein